MLINCSRGGIVNEAALAHALHAGVVAGARFNVLSQESSVADNPLLALHQPNFILTLPIAWASSATRQFMADQLIDNVGAFVRGVPQNLVI